MSTQKTAVMAITAAVCWGLRLSWGGIPLGGDGCSTGCSTLFVGETDRLVIDGHIAHGAVEVAVLAIGGVVIIARPEKKMGIGKQKVSPVANTAKIIPYPPPTIPHLPLPPPQGAGLKPLNRQRCVQKMFPSPLALKHPSLIVARCRFPI